LSNARTNAAQRFVGMIRSPRVTLSTVVNDPRSFALGVLIIVVATACSAGFLMTHVGRLAALDQEVRQLESFGTVITEARYAELRRLLPYRPVISAAAIVVGWPLMWVATAFILRAAGNRGGRQAGFSQVLAVVVHASSVFALRAIVATPINFARESLGGATSLGTLLPGLGESSFGARLFGALDIFVVWWAVLIAMGLSILYQTRTIPIARWLTQALRGGI
jgi:Yip1 domain